MILYIIRFSISLAIVFGFYKILLEKERSFVFNRLFLIGGLLVSLIVPLISFTGPEDFKVMLNSAQQTINYRMIRWELIVNIAYGFITLILLIRLAADLIKLVNRSRTGELHIIDETNVYLTNQTESPYSFFNAVFINKEQYEHIDLELIKHEIAHVKQRHTYDILFVEIIKTIFWINPLLNLYKKSIQLNHEFLADHIAIRFAPSTTDYQNTLLRFMTAEEPASITSGFNFSLTKKRLQMMNQTKSKLQRIKQFLVLPLLALVFWACSDNAGVSGKEMLEYWRYTANMEEILVTGGMNEADLKEGIIRPIETKEQYDELVKIYNRMNSAQKGSVYELPPYLEPIE